MALTKVIGEGIAGISNSSDATVLTLGSNEDVTLNAGNIVFAGSSKGVYLGVTSATASNLLDDYEEGTFTPTVIDSGGDLSASYSYNVGQYIKIGNLVTYSISITLSGGNGDDSDQVTIASLPFTSSLTTNLLAGTAVFGSYINTNTNYVPPLFGFLGNNQTAITLYEQGDNQSFENFRANRLSSNTSFFVTGSYYSA